MITADLISDEIRVQVPYVKVQIGDYTFGVFQKDSTTQRDSQGVYRIQSIQYPNYIQSLRVEKINGQVNTYTLSLQYAITQTNDPNFFEKVFSSISDTRKIIFSYGDLNAPAFLYRNEEAIITNVKEQVDIQNASITYEVTAVSTSNLTTLGAFTFPAAYAKPSDIIYNMLENNSKYGLLDIFTGMRNLDLVKQRGLIKRDDIYVNLEAKRNMSVLEYIQFLVKSMKSSTGSKDVYVFKVVDNNNDGIFNGPYFKIVNSSDATNALDCYSLDIGFDYKTNQAITSFQIDNNEAYSIFYKYYQKLTTNEYVQRIDDNGTLSSVYAPIVSSNNDQGITFPRDESWWNNVTQYPISATLQIRGLLRPAILMSTLDLGVIFFGKLFSATGKYLISQQTDEIGTNGFFSTLKLVRVGSSERYPNEKIKN